MSNITVNSKSNVSVVSEKDVPDETKRVMSVNAIPDVVLLSQKVLDFIEFYDRPDIVKMRLDTYPMYLNLLYDEFNMLPSSMIKLLSDEQNRRENLKGIIQMLESLQQVKMGKVSLESVHDEFVEDKNERFFYPTFGGKANLEKTLREEGHLD
jgi:hypothetical protein